jgi:ribosomal protein S18 acetylase RimI-like enzyme
MLTLRPATPADEAFLLEVYASTREVELAPLPWSPAEKSAFLQQQGRAQHEHYRTYFEQVDYSIILVNGRHAGRLYVARWPREFRIVDIALLPEYRNAGLGARLVRDVVAEAHAAGLPVTIHVESFNPARRLYARLGFEVAEDKGMYQLMKWTPEVTCHAG